MALLIPLFLMNFIGYSAMTLIIGVAFSFLLSIFIIVKSDMEGLFNKISNFKSVEKNVNIIKKWFNYGSPLSIWLAAGLALSFLDRYFINHYLFPIIYPEGLTAEIQIYLGISLIVINILIYGLIYKNFKNF